MARTKRPKKFKQREGCQLIRVDRGMAFVPSQNGSEWLPCTRNGPELPGDGIYNLDGSNQFLPVEEESGSDSPTTDQTDPPTPDRAVEKTERTAKRQKGTRKSDGQTSG